MDVPSTSNTIPAANRRSTCTMAMRSPHHDLEWTQPEGHFCDFEFDAEGGMNPKFSSFLAQSEPLDYFGLFLSEPIISKMVEETNLYATQVVMSGDAQPQSRIHDWVPTDNQEMKNFIAILGWMGIVTLPKISDYWSTNEVFSLPFGRKLMPRKRFELLLRFRHFADNTAFKFLKSFQKVSK